jgi:hypothetical protein
LQVSFHNPIYTLTNDETANTNEEPVYSVPSDEVNGNANEPSVQIYDNNMPGENGLSTYDITLIEKKSTATTFGGPKAIAAILTTIAVAIVAVVVVLTLHYTGMLSYRGVQK